MGVAFASTTALFAGDPEIVKSPAALASRFEEYKKALDAAPNTADGTAEIVPSESGAVVLRKTESPVAAMNRLLDQQAVEKAIGGDTLASLRQSLASVNVGEIQKEINLTSPIASGLVPFDLEAPAKFLVPIETPLRNKLPRKRGQGTARRYKRITGISNAQTTAGVPNLFPGITQSTQNNFAAGGASALNLIRGPQITYAGDEAIASYQQFSLSDQVTWAAQWSGQGFEDIRQLSQTSVLYSSMLAEERMTLYARGATAQGYLGPLSAVTTVTAAATAAAAGETGLAAGTYYVWVAAYSGFGTAVATASASVTVTAGQVVRAFWTPVAGAVGYQVFVSNSGATAATAFYYATVGSNGVATTSADAAGVTVQAPMPTTGATAPTTNTTVAVNGSGYDGILPIVLGPDSGYTRNINGYLSEDSPGSEFQAAFAAMYAGNLARPAEILFNGSDRVQLSNLLTSGNSAGVGIRINYASDGRSGHQLGQVVGALQNEVTGDMVDITVHPYMPQGTTAILTYQLPFPNSEVDTCWTYVNVQDYMGIQWPIVQFTYDVSSYWYGTFLCYAPAWQGSVSGIKLKTRN